MSRRTSAMCGGSSGVATDAPAPEIGGAAQLLSASWSRRRLQRIQVARDASQHRVGRRLELLPDGSNGTELVHGVS